jgi:glutathione peroxidase-family protein
MARLLLGLCSLAIVGGESIYDFWAMDIRNEHNVTLSAYRGVPILIINVASY